MKDAIEKAIEGGWKPELKSLAREFTMDGVSFLYKEISPSHYMRRRMLNKRTSIRYEAIFLDVLFWQALANAMNWSPLKDYKHTKLGQLYFKFEGDNAYEKFTGPEWYEKMHDFMDHLVDRKDAESFFDALMQ